MKFLIVFVALFAIAMAEDAQILRYDNDNIGVDGFNYAFETSDGTSANAEGHLDDPNDPEANLQVKGSYRYVGDDGQTYEVNYLANENGFQPEGAHLPVAP